MNTLVSYIETIKDQRRSQIVCTSSESNLKLVTSPRIWLYSIVIISNHNQYGVDWHN